jgi:hypothetical protein
MPIRTFPAIQSEDFTDRSSNQSGFFNFHSIVEVARTLFFSSILWLVLAMVLYAVYSLVAGSL